MLWSSITTHFTAERHYSPQTQTPFARRNALIIQQQNTNIMQYSLRALLAAAEQPEPVFSCFSKLCGQGTRQHWPLPMKPVPCPAKVEQRPFDSAAAAWCCHLSLLRGRVGMAAKSRQAPGILCLQPVGPELVSCSLSILLARWLPDLAQQLASSSSSSRRRAVLQCAEEPQASNQLGCACLHHVPPSLISQLQQRPQPPPCRSLARRGQRKKALAGILLQAVSRQAPCRVQPSTPCSPQLHCREH